MEIKPDLQIKPTHKLVMIPLLQQAIKMLKLSNIELHKKIEEELDKNPALEMDEDNNDYEANPDKDLILKKTSSEEKDTKNDDGSHDEYFFPDRNFFLLFFK